MLDTNLLERAQAIRSFINSCHNNKKFVLILGQTACTDGSTIELPINCLNDRAELMGLINHELGHVFYSAFYPIKNKDFHFYINSVEDARIEYFVPNKQIFPASLITTKYLIKKSSNKLLEVFSKNRLHLKALIPFYFLTKSYDICYEGEGVNSDLLKFLTLNLSEELRNKIDELIILLKNDYKAEANPNITSDIGAKLYRLYLENKDNEAVSIPPSPEEQEDKDNKSSNSSSEEKEQEKDSDSTSDESESSNEQDYPSNSLENSNPSYEDEVTRKIIDNNIISPFDVAKEEKLQELTLSEFDTDDDFAPIIMEKEVETNLSNNGLENYIIRNNSKPISLKELNHVLNFCSSLDICFNNNDNEENIEYAKILKNLLADNKYSTLVNRFKRAIESMEKKSLILPSKFGFKLSNSSIRKIASNRIPKHPFVKKGYTKGISTHIVLCLDVSGSMHYIEYEVYSCLAILNMMFSKLKSNLFDLSIILFGEKSRYLFKGKNDIQNIKYFELDDSETIFLPSLAMGIKELCNSQMQRKIILTITDGFFNENSNKIKKNELIKTINSLTNLGIESRAIFINHSGNTNSEIKEAISDYNFNSWHIMKNPSLLLEFFEDFLKELISQY